VNSFIETYHRVGGQSLRPRLIAFFVGLAMSMASASESGDRLSVITCVGKHLPYWVAGRAGTRIDRVGISAGIRRARDRFPFAVSENPAHCDSQPYTVVFGGQLIAVVDPYHHCCSEIGDVRRVSRRLPCSSRIFSAAASLFEYDAVPWEFGRHACAMLLF